MMRNILTIAHGVLFSWAIIAGLVSGLVFWTFCSAFMLAYKIVIWLSKEPTAKFAMPDASNSSDFKR